MASIGIDVSELEKYAELMKKAGREMKTEERKFLRTQGTALAKKTRQKARAQVKRTAVNREKYKRIAGQYHRSIRRGKYYVKDGIAQIRVYTSDPIAHLIEDGWTPKARNGQRGRHKAGRRIMAQGIDAIQSEYNSAVAKYVDEQLDKFAKEGRA